MTLTERQTQLTNELERGQQALAENGRQQATLREQAAQLRAQMLRIDGALKLLEELAAESDEAEPDGWEAEQAQDGFGGNERPELAKILDTFDVDKMGK